MEARRVLIGVKLTLVGSPLIYSDSLTESGWLPLRDFNYNSKPCWRTLCRNISSKFFKPNVLLQYNIKKKEEVVEPVQEEPNPLMRKKKTPEELAREAEAEDEDELTSECVAALRRIQKRCSILWMTSKCLTQLSRAETGLKQSLPFQFWLFYLIVLAKRILLGLWGIENLVC